MNKFNLLFYFSIHFFFLIPQINFASITNTTIQDNPVLAYETNTPPKIDGVSDDSCWALAQWQSIDQTWIPYGAVVSQSDFQGRYKVVWSSVTNRLYFLVEITDDVLVKGYQFPADGWYNYDCVELFIDENHSGGDHTFNNNAFAYHITAGNDIDKFQAIDVGSDQKPINYSNHMNVAIKNTGTLYTWEIELTVYNDQYIPGNESSTEVKLYPDKILGFTFAYCDNDDPNENPKTRDNFFGSVYLDQAHSNRSWQDAGLFGVLKLGPSRTNARSKTIQPGLKY